MEHFLPLAITSMVISLISIILLDYFGPSTISNPDKNQISDASKSNEVSGVAEDKLPLEETNMEITAELSIPINSVASKKDISQIDKMFILLNELAI